MAAPSDSTIVIYQSKPKVKVGRRFVSKMGSDFGFNFINSLAESVLLQKKGPPSGAKIFNNYPAKSRGISSDT